MLQVSMECRLQLRMVWTAVLVGVVGNNNVGILPVSAFVPQRCPIISRQSLAHTPWDTYPQETRRHAVMVASTSVKEEESLTLPEDDTFSLRGWWREISYPGSRPSTTVAKTFKDFAEKTGGVWRTRCLGLIPTTVSVCLALNAVIRRILYLPGSLETLMSCFPATDLEGHMFSSQARAASNDRFSRLDPQVFELSTG